MIISDNGESRIYILTANYWCQLCIVIMHSIAVPSKARENSCVEAREVFYLTDSVLVCVCMFCLGKNQSQCWLEEIDISDKARKCIKTQRLYFGVYEKDDPNSKNSFPESLLPARNVPCKFKLCWFKWSYKLEKYWVVQKYFTKIIAGAEGNWVTVANPPDKYRTRD